MMEQFLSLVVLPIGLGLLGFVEPCSVGSALVFIKHLEGKDASAKLAQVTVFALTRAVFIGLLGVLAVILGTAFLGFQRAAWIVLGSAYIVLGLIYLGGKAGVARTSLGPRIARLSNARGSVALGVLFGLNIPACAAPLLFALLGAVAAGGASGAPFISGFVSLSLFGLALSLPLIAAVLFAPARRGLIGWQPCRPGYRSGQGSCSLDWGLGQSGLRSWSPICPWVPYNDSCRLWAAGQRPPAFIQCGH